MNKKKIWISILILSALILTGCQKQAESSGETDETKKKDIQIEEDQNQKQAVTEEDRKKEELEYQIESILSSMTTEEKVAQMFVVVPEALMSDISCVTAAGEVTRQAIENIPVGGFVYLRQNIQTPSQTKDMLKNVQQYSTDAIGLPMFLCLDEEGGEVTRVAGNENFTLPLFEYMSVVGTRANEEEAYNIGQSIGGYLYELGFNVDFAPVADVLTNAENIVVRNRSFSSNPEVVSKMCNAVSNGLRSQKIFSTYKHFPGHGDTSADTHEGYAYSGKGKEELYACELIPYIQGIKENIPFIMVGHISFPNITGDYTPASLSYTIVQELLRNELGYKGIVITDAMNMGAISQDYTSGQAAVMAIQAGVDILLMPQNFSEAYHAVVEAVNNGAIPVERIDESLKRIIQIKLEMTGEINKTEE